MKKITLVLFTLLTLLPLGAWADEYVKDNVTYTYTPVESGTGTATVKSVSSDATTATIVASFTIGEEPGVTYNVNAFDNGAFNNCTVLGELIINSSALPTESKTFKNIANTNISITYKGIKYTHTGDSWYNGDSFKVTGHTDDVDYYDILDDINGVNVTAIGKNAFGKISNKTVNISKYITTIDNTAFIYFSNGLSDNANNLNNITVSSGNTKYSTKNGALYASEDDDIILITCISKSSYYDIWKDGVTVIGANAFICHKNLTSITIPATVKRIEESAFNCAGAGSLNVSFAGNKLETIGKSAFQKSTLTEIILPEGLQSVGESAFNGCTQLTTVNLPSSLTTMGGSAFRGCILLENITFNGNSLKTIPAYAFYNCKLTTPLYIPDGVVTIGEKAFNYDSEFSSNSALHTPSSEVRIPSSVTSIEVGEKASFSAVPTKKYKLNVTFEGTDEWATYYSIESLSVPTNLKAYAITGISSEDATQLTTEELSYIHKNEAILLHKTGNLTEDDLWRSAPTNDNVETDNNKKSDDNIFKGSTTGIKDINSFVKEKNESNKDVVIKGEKYVLSNDHFVKVNQGSLPPYRGFIFLRYEDQKKNPADYLYFTHIDNDPEKETDGNTYLYKEDGEFIKYDAQKGTASLSSMTNGKIKLTVTPGTNYYAYKSDISIRKNTTAAKGRAAAVGLDNTTWSGDALTIVGEDVDPDPSGKIEYTFDPNGTTEFEVTVNFHKRKFFNETTKFRKVTLEYTNTTYNGTAQEPGVTEVKFGPDKEDESTATTVDPKNYTISYANNTAAGSASVTITGQREFKETYTTTFSIAKRDINNITVNENLLESCEEDQRLTKTFTGSAITLTAEELGISDLKAGSTTEQAITENDYTITYENNITVSTETQKAKVNITSTNTDGSNYQSSKVVYFKIAPKEITANDIVIPDQAYNNGNPVEPKPTIKYGENTLEEGTDYDIEYADNVYSGVATATFTFKGNYTGTVNKEFNILNHDQAIHVEFDNPDNQWTTYYYKENLALVDGLKAYVVTDINSGKVNIAEVNFIPKNTPVLLYSESETKDFSLTTNYSATLPGDITPNGSLFKGSEDAQTVNTTADTKVFVLLNGQFVQTKGGEIAANRCYLVVSGDDATSMNVTTLDINKDMNAITILDNLGNVNTNIGTAVENTKGTLTVTPKNGYYVTADDITIIRNANTGSARAQQIDIDGGKMNVTAGDIVNNDDYSSTYTFTYDYNAAYQYQIVVKLQEATSFQSSKPTITFTNPTYNGLEQKAKPTVAYGENILKEGEDYVLIYPGDDYTKTGTGKKVTVYGIRKYCKDLSNNSFTINQRDISNIKPAAKDGQIWKDGNGLDTANPQVYFSGSAMELNFTDIVTYKDAENQDQELDLLANDNLSKEITVTYSNNTAVGTATATIKSKDVNYKGTERTITFQILRKRLTTNDVTINDIPDQSYTGNEIAPVLTIKYNNVTLMEGADKDYTVAYSNNTNAGEATATITFLGNYSGSVTKTFKITEAEETVTINFDSANEWTTYYGSKNLSLTDELEAFVVTGIEGTKLTTASVEFIPQKTPVLLHRKSGTNTTFNVMTCSTESLDAPITPNSIFKGSLESTDISTADANNTKFILLNGQFVQATEGTLGAGRCYITLGTPPTGVNTLTIGKPSDGIIILEEGANPTQSSAIGSVTKATGNGKATLTVKANNGWYAEAKDITVVRSASANKGRAPQVDGNNVTLTSGEITTNKDYNTTYLFTYPYSSDYQYQVTVNFHKSTKLNEANPTITLNPTSYEYDNSEKKPAVTVKIGDVTLEENKDYVVSYENNVNKGIGKVNINGIRKYANGTYSEFNISQRDIKKVTVGAIEDQTFTGKAIEPSLTITDLVNEKDIITTDQYTIEYKQNINAGTATVTIIGKNNYTSSKSVNFTITPKTMTAENIANIDTQQYDAGKEIKPALSINYGDIPLTEGEETGDKKDYTVRYEDNTEAGTAKAIVNFYGNYSGTNVVKEFTIVDDGLPKKTVKVQFDSANEWTTFYSKETLNLEEFKDELEAFVVTGIEGKNVHIESAFSTSGKSFIPQNTPVLLHRKSGNSTDFEVKTCSGEKLPDAVSSSPLFIAATENKDISTITGKKFVLFNGKFVQTAEGTVAANRCYLVLESVPEGVQELTINRSVNDITVLDDLGNENKDIGTAIETPKGTLTIKPNRGYYVTADDITIVRNTNAGSARAQQIDVDDSKVKVTAGNIVNNADNTSTYTFTYEYNKAYQYQIIVKFQKSTELKKETTTITLNPNSYEYDKTVKQPQVTSVKVKIGDKDETLTKDVDYVVTYPADGNINAGKGKVFINGIRKYNNELNQEFDITKRVIANHVTLKAQDGQTWVKNHELGTGDAQVIFTGKDIEVDVVDIVKDAKNNETNIITTDDYNISYNNKNHKNASTTKAEVTISSKGSNYQGSKPFYFTILPKEMTGDDVKFKDNKEEYEYTGEAIEPEFIITYLDNEIVKGTDYDVAFENNVYAGNATAKVTFKGNYTGVVNKTFIIGDHGQTVSVNFENPDNKWTTYYYKENIALPTDGSLKAYVVTGYEGKEVQTQEVDFIPKNTPVLLYSESGEKNFNLTTNYSATTNVTPANIFKGTEEGVDIKTISGTTFVLVNGKFVLAAEGTLAANRCYLVISDEEAKKMGVSELTIKSSGNEIIYQENGKTNNSIGTASTSTPKDGKVILTVKPKKGYYINGTEDITVIKNAKAESARAQKIDDGKVTVNAGKITDNADHTSTYLFTYPYEQNCQYQITVNFHQATNITETGKQPTITFKDDVVYNGLEQKAEPEVVTYDGTKLTKNVDYVLSYPGDDYINAGTGKKVTVTGIRKYVNELSQNSFEIKPRNVSELTISGQEGQTWIEGHTPADATPQIVYTSKAIEVNVSDDIVIEGAKKSIITENDITVTYSNNLNAGTATVTIKNKQGGNYTGERVFNFEIVAKMMTADEIDAIPDQHYTGKAITPDITVKNGAITLVKGTDYEVDYSNNTDAGAATAIVNFKGNYAGENVKKTFKILEVEEEHTINFDNKNEWTTYYYDKNLSLPEEVEAFVVTGIEGATLNTAPVDFIPQNTPVLLRRMSGTNTTFSVKTCSTKRLDESTVPNTDLFKGSLEGIANIKTVDTDKAKFVLLNNEFVQTTEGALGANRCYLAVSTPAEGINTLTIGNPTMDIVILEDNATPQQANIIGKASKSTNGTTTTLTVTANNGWYVEANDITVVRSTNAEKGRAPQVGGENIKVNAGKRTDHENYTTTYLFTYPYSSDYTYQVKVNFHKSTRLNEAKPTITLNPTSFEYDNSEKKPSVTVKIGDVTLKEKEDYVISYENNILPSTEVKGNVLINGIRKYATQVNKNFDINRRDINKAVIEGIEKTSLTYTGNEVEWKIKDLVKNENIIKEDDYTFTCTKEMIKDAGEYTITLEGSNNYQGKKEVTFTIQPKNLTGKAVIDPIEAINENGSPITPALTIRDGAITLNPETDYDVTYTNNVEDGKATATITFKGNYTGKAETNFTINHVAKDVPLNITFDKDNEWTTFFYTNNIIVPDGLKAYIIIGLNGKDITPKEVDFIPENVPVLLYREDKDKSDAFIGKTMPSDTKLSENIKPDSRFCGTLESIDIKTISGNKFVLLDNMFVQAVEGTLAANHCYINATISDVAELAIGKAIDARIYLEEGNPSTVGGIAETSTPDEKGLITLTIKPNPNFYAEAKDIKVVSSASANDARAPQIDGSHVELTPVDETADPSGETQYTYKYSEGYHYQITVNFHKCVNFTNKETRPTVSITETSFVYNGTERKPIPTVIYNGVPLIENTDYAVIYQNNFNAGGASVVIKGKGHYSGEFIGATFNITKRSINSDNVKVEFKQNSFTYTGSPIKPEFTVTETITVGEETINIITTDDYEIAEWYNNTIASTSEKKAKLALHGIRNYDDFKDVYFEIQPKRLYKSNIKAIDNQEYTGSPIQPELTIMDGEYTLTSDDYDVKYSNNIYEGTAYVDVTFKGNYMGKVQTTFDILYRSLKREIDITFEGSNQWTTFYWNENLDIEGQGLTAYVVTGHEQGSTKLITEEVNFIPKNTGVLLYRTNTANAGPFYGMTMPTNTKLEGVTPDRNLFVGSMDSKDLADVKGVKFILVNDQFVQTTEGMLAAHRCYANFGDGKGIEGISNIETDKDLDAIIYKEEGEDRKAGSIGTVTLSEPQNGRKTLTVEPKPGFYAEPENITIIRSVDGTTARAAQVPSVEDKVVVTATNPSANPSKKTTYTFPYEEGYHYQIIVDFQKCADFTKGVTITLGNQTFEYDGNEKKPTVTAVYIKDNNGRNIKLKSNYYTISYANNINAGGAARVIVEGNWYYYGANGVNFNISQRDISKAKIEVNIPTQIYTGKPIEIDPKYIVVSDMVTINGKQKNIITENDYELVYSNNVEAGTAKVTVMPTKINYNGHGREYTFNIIMPIKGDANRDGLVNVTDIVEIVNYILGRPTSRFYFEGADVNEDGLVNVTDIVLVVNIILNGDNSVATREAIDEALADIWDEYVTAINNIKQEETVDVFDLKGRKVRANATDLKGLPQGVYIVRDKKMNTKKVFVK